MATSGFFPVDKDSTSFSAGEQTGISTYRHIDGTIDRTTYTVRCIVTSTVNRYVNRGLSESEAESSVSGGFSDATWYNAGAVGSRVVLKFPEASGTKTTIRAHRVNEADFWEQEKIVETRTYSFVVVSREVEEEEEDTP